VREVCYVTIREVVIYNAVGKRKTTADNTCDLKTWKRWARNGLVVAHGPDEPLQPDERRVAFNRDLDREVLAIANKVMTEVNRPRLGQVKISCSPSDEAARALIELGLAYYWSRDYSARWLLRDRVVELCEKEKAARA
jgi:hypothetical protein